MPGSIGTSTLELQVDQSGLKVGFRKAENETRKSSQNLENIANSAVKNITGLLSGVLGTVAIGTAIKNATELVAEFDDTLRNTQSVLKATSSEFEDLRDSALGLAKDSRFTAREVGAAQYNLASAFGSVTAVLKTQESTLQLAAAGQADLAETGNALALTLKTLELDLGQVTDVADIFTRVVQTSAVNMEIFFRSLTDTVPIVQQFGIPLEQAAAALGVLADGAIKGQRAGIAFRNIIASLINPIGEAKDIVEEFGLQLTDAEGKTRDLGEVFERMRRLNPAQIFKVFGREVAIAAGVLANADFDTKLQQIQDRAGATGEAALVQEAGIGGTLRGLQSSLQTLTDLLARESGLISALDSAAKSVKSFSDFLQRLAEAGHNVGAAVNQLLRLGAFVVFFRQLNSWVKRTTQGFDFLQTALNVVTIKGGNFLYSLEKWATSKGWNRLARWAFELSELLYRFSGAFNIQDIFLKLTGLLKTLTRLLARHAIKVFAVYEAYRFLTDQGILPTVTEALQTITFLLSSNDYRKAIASVTTEVADNVENMNRRIQQSVSGPALQNAVDSFANSFKNRVDSTVISVKELATETEKSLRRFTEIGPTGLRIVEPNFPFLLGQSSDALRVFNILLTESQHLANDAKASFAEITNELEQLTKRSRLVSLFGTPEQQKEHLDRLLKLNTDAAAVLEQLRDKLTEHEVLEIFGSIDNWKKYLAELESRIAKTAGNIIEFHEQVANVPINLRNTDALESIAEQYTDAIKKQQEEFARVSPQIDFFSGLYDPITRIADTLRAARLAREAGHRFWPKFWGEFFRNIGLSIADTLVRELVFPRFNEILNKLFNRFTRSIREFFRNKSLKDILFDLQRTLLRVARQLARSFRRILRSLYNFLNDIFDGQFWQSIINGLKQLIPQFINVFKLIGNKIIDVLGGIFDRSFQLDIGSNLTGNIVKQVVETLQGTSGNTGSNFQLGNFVPASSSQGSGKTEDGPFGLRRRDFAAVAVAAAPAIASALSALGGFLGGLFTGGRGGGGQQISNLEAINYRIEAFNKGTFDALTNPSTQGVYSLLTLMQNNFLTHLRGIGRDMGKVASRFPLVTWFAEVIGALRTLRDFTTGQGVLSSPESPTGAGEGAGAGAGLGCCAALIATLTSIQATLDSILLTTQEQATYMRETVYGEYSLDGQGIGAIAANSSTYLHHLYNIDNSLVYSGKTASQYLAEILTEMKGVKDELGKIERGERGGNGNGNGQGQGQSRNTRRDIAGAITGSIFTNFRGVRSSIRDAGVETQNNRKVIIPEANF